MPFVLVGLFASGIYWVLNNPPEAKRKGAAKPEPLAVEVVTMQPRRLPIKVQSFGMVGPQTQTTLISQVSGKIVSISPHFREGGFIEKDEVLVTLDSRDYDAQVSVSQANLQNALQVLSEEQAKGEQAAKDWARLGKRGTASDLTLRKPQLRAAKAAVASARAQLTIAKLNQSRTKIRSPYAGRIREKHVDVGQVISASTALAVIFSSDVLEVRLPISNSDLPYVDLPESYRGEASAASSLSAELFSAFQPTAPWQAKIVRTESAIDASNQQLHVIAQIDDPYGRQAKGRMTLKIGEYVTATIQGKILEDALVVPNQAIYQGTYVYVVKQGSVVQQPIEIAWRDDAQALIQSGLQAGDQVVTTALGQVPTGTPVRISGDESGQKGQRRKQAETSSQARSNTGVAQ